MFPNARTCESQLLDIEFLQYVSMLLSHQMWVRLSPGLSSNRPCSRPCGTWLPEPRINNKARGIVGSPWGIPNFSKAHLMAQKCSASWSGLQRKHSCLTCSVSNSVGFLSIRTKLKTLRLRFDGSTVPPSFEVCIRICSFPMQAAHAACICIEDQLFCWHSSDIEMRKFEPDTTAQARDYKKGER